MALRIRTFEKQTEIALNPDREPSAVCVTGRF